MNPASQGSKWWFENYNTKLDDENEKRFRLWATQRSKQIGRDILMDLGDYDVRGFWLKGGFKETGPAGHGPDTFKKPNHPTFSNESIYHDTPTPWGGKYKGGSWSNDGKADVFRVSPEMLRFTHNKKGLENYMKVVEPGVVLKFD